MNNRLLITKLLLVLSAMFSTQICLAPPKKKARQDVRTTIPAQDEEDMLRDNEELARVVALEQHRRDALVRDEADETTADLERAFAEMRVRQLRDSMRRAHQLAIHLNGGARTGMPVMTPHEAEAYIAEHGYPATPVAQAAPAFAAAAAAAGPDHDFVDIEALEAEERKREREEAIEAHQAVLLVLEEELAAIAEDEENPEYRRLSYEVVETRDRIKFLQNEMQDECTPKRARR